MKIKSLNIQNIVKNPTKNHYLKLIKNHMQNSSHRLFHSQQHCRHHSSQPQPQNNLLTRHESKKHNLRQIFQQNILQSDTQTHNNLIIKNHQFIPLNINKFNPANLYLRNMNNKRQILFKRNREQGSNFYIEKVVLTQRIHKSLSVCRQSKKSLKKMINQNSFFDFLSVDLKEKNGNVDDRLNNIKMKIGMKGKGNRLKGQENRSKNLSFCLDKQNLNNQSKNDSEQYDNSTKIKWHPPKPIKLS